MQEELGGAVTHTTKSLVAHGAFANDVEALRRMREFFDFLPLSNRGTLWHATTFDLHQNASCNAHAGARACNGTCGSGASPFSPLVRVVPPWADKPPSRYTHDSPSRYCDMLEGVVPTDPNIPYDMKMVMRNVADEGTLFEVMPDAAKNIVVGFARLNGQTVGMVGNEPMELAGCLDINSSVKVCICVVSVGVSLWRKRLVCVHGTFQHRKKTPHFTRRCCREFCLITAIVCSVAELPGRAIRSVLRRVQHPAGDVRGRAGLPAGH